LALKRERKKYEKEERAQEELSSSSTEVLLRVWWKKEGGRRVGRSRLYSKIDGDAGAGARRAGGLFYLSEEEVRESWC
jgi:hypothetical protein